MHAQMKEEALKFLMAQKGGVLSTVWDDQPQSAFIYYDADEDFSIYFPTIVNTRKDQNIQAHNKVAFTVSTINPPRTVQIEGVAEQITDKEMIEAVMANYMDIATYQMKHAAPITKLERGKGVLVYKIRPTWLRWSDFSDAKIKKDHSVSVVLIDSSNQDDT
jgi:general stress protein 26